MLVTAPEQAHLPYTVQKNPTKLVANVKVAGTIANAADVLHELAKCVP
jgi:hypothetical protein